VPALGASWYIIHPGLTKLSLDPATPLNHQERLGHPLDQWVYENSSGPSNLRAYILALVYISVRMAVNSAPFF